MSATLGTRRGPAPPNRSADRFSRRGSLVAAEPELRADVLFGAAACQHLDELSATELMDRWAPRELAS